MLLQLNGAAVALGVLSLVPVVLYPLAKRVTDYPQFVLGLTFGWGAPLGYAAATGAVDGVTAALYAASLGLSLVVANWVVELLERTAGAEKSAAGIVGGLALLLGVITRPLGGWILREHPERVRVSVGASLAAGAVGTAALVVGDPLGLAAAGGALLGLAAGIPFAPAFTGAALAGSSGQTCLG